MSRLFFAACCVLVLSPMAVWAQKNEVSFSAGGGGVFSHGESVSAPAYTLAYTRSLTDHLAVEGAFELFYLKGDGFAGAQVAALYHFRPAYETRRVIPYVTAGIGKTTTDFTEIESQVVVRLGGGFKYYIWDALGLRVEFRDEIIRTGNNPYYPLPGSPQHFLSARAGVVFRF